MERQAALYFDKAAIYLPDFQMAASMIVKPVEGETHSEIFKPNDSVAVLRLMDEIRKSWDMKFSFE